MKLKVILISVLVISILFCLTWFLFKKIPGTKIVDKSNNVCSQNSDCQYIWFTGGCYTPEYVAKVQKSGVRNGEARRREGVTCTCEQNMCKTHN
jgi:hypothetical protein